MKDADNAIELELGEEAAEIEPNSDAYKEKKEKRKRHEDVEYTITVRQKTFGQKLKEAVFGEDVKNVPEHVFFNIVVPNVMRMFGDSIQGALSMTFRGIGGKRSNRDDDDIYRDYSRTAVRNRRRNSDPASEINFDDYIFNSRYGVEHVIDVLEDLLDEYDVITVADVCTQVGKTPRGVDNRYGWKSTREFEVIQVREGWILSVPRAKYLD